MQLSAGRKTYYLTSINEYYIKEIEKTKNILNEVDMRFDNFKLN